MATRRGFLHGVAAGSVLIGCRGKEDTGTAISAELREEEPASWTPEGIEDRQLFPYGIRVGDAAIDSAIIAVYTVEDVASIQFELRKAEGMEWIADKEGTIDLEDGHGQLELMDLESDTAYSIVCLSSDGTARSQVTRFRTALSDDDWRIVTFGASSCLGGNLPWPSLTQAKNDKYDISFCMSRESSVSKNHPGILAHAD